LPNGIGGKPKVLVKVIDGRFIEVYSSSDIDVEVINAPAVTAANLALAEQLVDAALPAGFRFGHMPGHIRGTGQVEHLTPADIQHRATWLQLFNSLLGGRSESELIDGQQAILAAMGGGLAR
jgi:hypothetical protein